MKCPVMAPACGAPSSGARPHLMIVAEVIVPRLAAWRTCASPVSETDVAALRRDCPFNLPTEYFELLAITNGGEGELGLSYGWFQLWSARDCVAHNKGYEVAEYHPGFWGFGSSGGGVMFAFKSGSGSTVFGVPFDSIDPQDFRIVAKSFAEFLLALGAPRVGAV